MFFKKFIKLVVLSFILTFATISFSYSVSLPCGTAKLIVPWGAGGGTDVIFRQMVDKINKNGCNFRLISNERCIDLKVRFFQKHNIYNLVFSIACLDQIEKNIFLTRSLLSQ